MTWIIIYACALGIVCCYAAIHGGAPERWTAVIFTAGSIASVLQVQPPNPYHHVFWSIAAIDIVILGAISGIAIAADRFWPLSLAALQLMTVGLHGIRAYDATILPYAYWLLVGKVSYLMLFGLAIGTMRHRDRLGRGWPEYAWTAQRHARRSVARD